MKKNYSFISKLFVLFAIIFLCSFNFIFAANTKTTQNQSTRQQIQIKNNWIQPLLWNRLWIDIWNWFNAQWYTISIQDKIQKQEVKINETQLDLSVDNDIIYNINKKYFQEKQKKKAEFENEIEIILSKVEKKETTIDNVNSKYKKYIEIEDAVNKADYIYVLALPIDQFLFKSDWDLEKIIITRDPILQNNSWTDDPSLEKTIQSEIQEVMLTADYAEMRDKINYFREKYSRDYSSIFVEKTLEQFYNDLHINISYKDKLFVQSYTYQNKRYMNSLEYLPKKLKQLEKYTEDYYLIYIPFSVNQNVSNILKWLDNQKQIFKNSSEMCVMIEYNDNYQEFEDYFCWFNETFWWNTIRVKQIKLHNNNNYYITLAKRWLMSVFLEILFLIWCWAIPFVVIKLVDKVINFGSKFETEQL